MLGQTQVWILGKARLYSIVEKDVLAARSSVCADAPAYQRMKACKVSTFYFSALASLSHLNSMYIGTLALT